MNYARKDSIRSNAFIVGLLHDCIVGQEGLVQELLEFNVGGFLETFYKHMAKQLEVSNTKGVGEKQETTWEEEVMNWMKAFYPAPVIENNIRRMITNYGTEHLTQATRFQLHDWVSLLQNNLDFSKEALNDDLLRLSRVVSWLADHVLLDPKGKL